MQITSEMTIIQAVNSHPRAKEVFARFNLGGCSSCSVAGYETIQQVCDGYSIPIDDLLNTLNSLE